MNCFCKTTHVNIQATSAAESAPTVVGISVHGIGISIFKNKFFDFGL